MPTTAIPRAPRLARLDADPIDTLVHLANAAFTERTRPTWSAASTELVTTAVYRVDIFTPIGYALPEVICAACELVL